MGRRKFYIAGFLLLITGFTIGIGAYFLAISSLAEQKSRAFLLFSAASEKLYRPVRSFYSDNIHERIAAYYSSLEINYISADFLKKRFDEETQPAAKRTILYVIKIKNKKMYDELKSKSDITEHKFRDNHEKPILF